ncbi:beta-N-acetylhexosaminidase [Candidatus Marithrix sp. Canyon 246]|nr:beta-N-acetylhexosaminidase [Candidatus Marithrix sp. Canyon 246]
MWFLVKKIGIFVFFIPIMFLQTACEMKKPSPSPTNITQNDPKINKTDNTDLNKKSGVSDKPEEEKVSLEEKIGQMLLVGFRGFKVDDNSRIIQDIKKFHLGGVILFDYDFVLTKRQRNIQSSKQVKKLVKDLQAASQTSLFIAIDQEGGKVRRLRNKFGFLVTHSAQYFGKKNKPKLTYDYASKIAKKLTELGINLNFAPVVDLNINPNNPIIGKVHRSFSKYPKVVTQHASEFIRAHHKNSVLCAIKHFPGHGSSTKDSHLGIVDVTNTWKETELQPYRNLIQEQLVDAIMVAHVFNKNFDKQYPATLSKQIVDIELRQKLGYNGVVISDDMQMKAITKSYNFKTAIEKVIEAGIDIIVIGNNIDYDEKIVEKTVHLIKNLINDGKITEDRIEQSYKRIIALKGKIPGFHVSSTSSRNPQKKYKLISVEGVSPNTKIKIMNTGSNQHGVELEQGNFYNILVDNSKSKPKQIIIRMELE